MLTRIALVLALSIGTANAAPPTYEYVVGTGATPCASMKAADADYAANLGNTDTTAAWFPLIVLTNGGCAVQIDPASPMYGASVSLPASDKFPDGLSMTLQSEPAFNAPLVTRASLAGILPDVLTLTAFENELPAPALAYLNGLSSGAIYTYWQSAQAAHSVDLQDPSFSALIYALLTTGQVTLAQASALISPAATKAGP